MQNLPWITGTLMMVCSLGMTRMLSSAVSLFRSRREVTFDWIPLVWAGCLFYSLLNFSFALTALGSLGTTWDFHHFLILFAVVIILFVASALILPMSLEKGDSLRASFERDGRWALAFLAAYESLVIVLDCQFWHQPLFSIPTAFNLLLALGALGMLFTRKRSVERVLTIGFAGVMLYFEFLVN